MTIKQMIIEKLDSILREDRLTEYPHLLAEVLYNKGIRVAPFDIGTKMFMLLYNGSDTEVIEVTVKQIKCGFNPDMEEWNFWVCLDDETLESEEDLEDYPSFSSKDIGSILFFNKEVAENVAPKFTKIQKKNFEKMFT